MLGYVLLFFFTKVGCGQISGGKAKGHISHAKQFFCCSTLHIYIQTSCTEHRHDLFIGSNDRSSNRLLVRGEALASELNNFEKKINDSINKVLQKFK